MYQTLRSVGAYTASETPRAEESRLETKLIQLNVNLYPCRLSALSWWAKFSPIWFGHHSSPAIIIIIIIIIIIKYGST